MKRDLNIYLEDILESSNKIAKYIKDKTAEQFKKDDELQDAVIRRLQIIGEAVKRLPQEFRNKNSDIDWRKAAAMLDVLVHDYDDIDMDRVWLTITVVLPSFKIQVEKITGT